MDLEQAIKLIQFDTINTIQHWADLGCGAGTFTYALATLLAPGSTIYAVDREIHLMTNPYDEVTISFIEMDFVNNLHRLPDLHGILMANSLHFIESKKSFLQSVKKKLVLGDPRLLVVEYETNQSNPWVPYPIRFKELKALMTEIGAKEMHRIGEVPSRYHGTMYAAMVRF